MKYLLRTMFSTAGAVVLLTSPVWANHLQLRPVENNTPAAAAPSDAGGQAAAPEASDQKPAEAAAPAAASNPAPAADAAKDEAAPSAAPSASNEEVIKLIGNKPAEIPSDQSAMLLPSDDSSIDFTKGAWKMDRDFVKADGTPVHASFTFDENGLGTAELTDANNVKYLANAVAKFEDGKLKVKTGRFTAKGHPGVFPAQYVECSRTGACPVCGKADCLVHGAGLALCNGTDGWNNWEGEHLLALDKAARGGIADVLKEAEHRAAAPAAAENRKEAPAPARAEAPAAQPAGPAELTPDGAELPGEVLDAARKAQASAKSGVAALAGDWQYSRDFARKSDGGSVVLQFHFDDKGAGTSVIKDGGKDSYKSSATVAVMPDGTLRVRTGSYLDGSNAERYFPTFMECRKGSGKDLSCDVSNGWTRIENGALVSLSDLDSRGGTGGHDELVPVAAPAQAPAAAPAPSVEDMLPVFDDRKAADAAPAAPQLVIPEKASDMDFLEGHWRCDTGLVRTSDNQPVVVEFKFDGSGKGSSAIREQDGTVYRATARAKISNGRLRINTSDYYAGKNQGKYSANFVECEQNGQYAICNGRNGNARWEKAGFTRIK